MNDDGSEPKSEMEVRLSNAEREAIVDRLKLAQDEGRIDLFEFEERVGQVYAARVSSDVAGVLDDLPVDQPPAPSALIEVQAVAINRRRWMFAVLSGQTSNGRWTPGAPNRTVTILGSQTLDLTRVDAAEVDIRAFTMLGETKIIVPPGARVDLGGFMFMGESSNKTDDEDGVSTMVVRVRSYGWLAECSVRTPGVGAAIKKAFKKRLREFE